MEMRRKDPQDDLLTGLVHAEIDDGGTARKLTLEEILAFVQLISSAGTETVARLLGFGVVTLQRYPDQRQLLLDDPSLMGNAVEELLRFEAPSPTQSRWVARDVEYHGITIPAGSKISLLNGSADRDERHFPNPDVFDVRRDIDRHLALGYGAHYCIGAALARMETRVALSETLKRYPTWEIDESRLEFVHTATVRGYASVPMRVR
jgi:cytochrome P450